MTIQSLNRSRPPQRLRTGAAQLPAAHSDRPLGTVRSHADHGETRTVSVVIPAMNEERNIAWVLERIPPYVDEILLVDGHSTDNTVGVARQARPDVQVVPQRGCGKGAAMRTGFEDSFGDYVVVLDADGSMDPGEIDYYVSALDDGYDLVKGSRELPGGGSMDLTPLRRWGNHVLVTTVNVTWGSEFTDLCYGYLAFKRERLDDLALTGRGFEIETEITINAIHAGLRIAEVPTVELSRHYGTSNLNAWRDGRRILGFLTRARLHPRSRPVTDRIDRRALTATPWA
ncbi:MAG: glycosyl transferase family 2 [Nocardioides sp.]|nr:glycosyl transferase family 2 [Nocardioides sp.]